MITAAEVRQIDPSVWEVDLNHWNLWTIPWVKKWVSLFFTYPDRIEIKGIRVVEK